MIKYFISLFNKTSEKEVKVKENNSKSFEHLLWEAENSVENNQRKQDLEDESIERHCRNEADRIFWEQVAYSDRNRELNKSLYGDNYNPKKIYGGLIFINPGSSFIMMHSGAKSKWDTKSTNDRVYELLKEKFKKWENE